MKRILKLTSTAIELNSHGYATDPSHWNKLDDIYPDCWGQVMRNNCSPVCVSSKFLEKGKQQYMIFKCYCLVYEKKIKTGRTKWEAIQLKAPISLKLGKNVGFEQEMIRPKC